MDAPINAMSHMNTRVRHPPLLDLPVSRSITARPGRGRLPEAQQVWASGSQPCPGLDAYTLPAPAWLATFNPGVQRA